MLGRAKRDLFPHQPERPEGATCPFGKPTCKGCMLWMGQPVVGADKVERTEWRCALVWAAIAGPVNAARLDGVQAALEGLRNQFGAFHQSTLALVARVATVGRQLAPPPATPLIEMEANGAPQLSDH